ncbi:uncharacterized protein LOC100377854 [Saccoglossus kowalevskii]|uniref:Protein AIG1-like n=1 Tax=Saccoglossus kowalevskii TaxID=10224 RepID=A0ABM0N093_SACKO|nr:PREDICTED: protein AIG1-like [Saccoglossus kowalevskii]
MELSNCRQKLVLLLLGLTKSGKSATGNSILGEHKFRCGRSYICTTKVTEYGTCGVEREIVVIDTPPILDPSDEMTAEHVLQEIGKGMFMAKSESRGIDAIILTLNANDRLTKEHDASVDWLRLYFGDDNLSKYGIVLVTRKDQLDEDNLSVKDFLLETPPSVRGLLKRIDNRVVAFANNSRDNDVRQTQVSELLSMVDGMRKENMDSLLYMRENEENVLQMERLCRLSVNETSSGLVQFLSSRLCRLYHHVLEYIGYGR